MITFQIFDSDMKNKKYKVIIYKNEENIKTVHFGDSRYNDFIEYNKINSKLANERNPLYLLRHKNDNYNNFLTASFWAKNILWNLPTLAQSIKSINLN
jgi:hypothetical protein